MKGIGQALKFVLKRRGDGMDTAPAHAINYANKVMESESLVAKPTSESME